MTNRDEGTQPRRSPLRSRLVSWPLTLIGLTAVAMLAANTVSAWGRGHGGDFEELEQHAARKVERILDELDASEAQSEAIQAIVAETIGELQAAKADRDATHAELRELLTAQTIDRDALEALRSAGIASADSMTQRVAERFADVMEILTPEQRAELVARFETMRERHGGHRWH